MALVTSGLLYNLTFFLLTGSPDFRYCVWTILGALLGVFALPEALRSAQTATTKATLTHG